MFKRRKPQPSQPVVRSEAAPLPVAEGAAEPSAPAEAAATPVERTTCYPKSGEGPPHIAGQPRTTVYRQALGWNRGGYDTVN